MLELDHVFCMVGDPAQAAPALERDGWVLDAGQAHRGQGTRNRRLAWSGQYLELLWLTDAAEARANPLRLDRRFDWATTGASPFGLGFRGRIDPAQADEFWLYDALGPRIWVHHDDERRPERPLVFVLEADEHEMRERARRRRAMSEAAAHRRRGDLREVRLRGPSAPSLPSFTGPAIRFEPGPHLMELVVGGGGSAVSVGDVLVVRG